MFVILITTIIIIIYPFRNIHNTDFVHVVSWFDNEAIDLIVIPCIIKIVD